MPRIACHLETTREAYSELTARYSRTRSPRCCPNRNNFKSAVSQYLGRGSPSILDPMGAPGQINARNYGPNYFVLFSGFWIVFEMEQIRHTIFAIFTGSPG